MLANIEYKLVRNNYVEMVNKPDLLIYRKRDDPIAQLTIRKDSNSYSLSFEAQALQYCSVYVCIRFHKQINNYS